jgi:glycosyltransferase involved in cell wall biosynthesis
VNTLHPGPPRVSLGMPVYNGANYLRCALDSILAQTFQDWELIICDNASSDETQAICEEYAARDPRIQYHRSNRNIGPEANYNRTFELSRGEYFKWAAHDDVLEPTYLEQTVRVLDTSPEVVLAYTDVMLIDGHGTPIRKYEFELGGVDSGSAVRRFASLIFVNHRLHRATEIFGLMRSAALRQTTLQGCYARADSVLLARMALLGRFRKVREPLFLSREHSAQSMAQKPTASRLEAVLRRWLGVGPIPPPEWWDSTLRDRIVWPEWRIAAEYWRSIGLMRLGPVDRMLMTGCYVLWLVRHIPKLVRDLVFAVVKLLPSVPGPRRVPRSAESSA